MACLGKGYAYATSPKDKKWPKVMILFTLTIKLYRFTFTSTVAFVDSVDYDQAAQNMQPDP